MTTNAITRKNELVQLLAFATDAMNQVQAGKVMKQFKTVLGIVCRRRTDFLMAVSGMIDQIKKELVEVEKDVNAVEGEVVKPATVSRAPVSVLVHWSESCVFKGEEVVYQWEEFERLAKCAAAANGNVRDNGYSKTKVTVVFDDATSYQCRLDLALGDTVGFADHCRQMIRSFEVNEDYRNYIKSVRLTEHLKFIKTIKFC